MLKSSNINLLEFYLYFEFHIVMVLIYLFFLLKYVNKDNIKEHVKKMICLLSYILYLIFHLSLSILKRSIVNFISAVGSIFFQILVFHLNYYHNITWSVRLMFRVIFPIMWELSYQNKIQSIENYIILLNVLRIICIILITNKI